jgi:hypothetical protein
MNLLDSTKTLVNAENKLNFLLQFLVTTPQFRLCNERRVLPVNIADRKLSIKIAPLDFSPL